jgi:hypothetical protein
VAKSDYSIKQISKGQAKEILFTYHYLKDHSKTFRSGFNYGCFIEDKLVGVCIFTPLPVPELVTGMFGLDRNNQDGLYELSRLCLIPYVQKIEHNLASWFVARAINQFRKDTDVKAILSYADEDYHHGTIYAASNFKYYGLTDKKPDFWIKQPDGTFIKHSRGKTKGIEGEWRPRPRKHRFLKVFDKQYEKMLKWKQVKWENKNAQL